MAATGKKKGGKKQKGVTLNLNEFLAEPGGSAGPGTSYVLANKPVSWADEMETHQDMDEILDFGDGPAKKIDRMALPTAPRAARGPDCDMNRVPSEPPYTAFLGNLPFDVSTEEIERFFRGLTVVNVRIPQGRTKGFGYAEFSERAELCEALSLNDGMLRNRKIRIDLADQHGDKNDRRDDRYGDGEDRTLGDWRRRDGPPPTDDRYSRDRYGDRDRGFDRGSGFDRDGDRDRGFMDRDSNRGFGDRDRGFGDRDRQYGDRDRSFGDRDRGFGGDRDRGFGGDRDRGFGGDRDRNYGDRDRGFGERDRGFGDRDRYGDRDRFGDRRGGGFDRDRRDDDKDFGRRSFGTGFRGDRDRYDRYNRDRYPRDDRRGYDDPPDRGGEPKERPRLQLQPRSKPLEETGNSKQTSSSIFGGAKPVDTASREREIEERIQRQKDHEFEKIEQEKENRIRLSSSTSDKSRSRRDSEHSQDGSTGGGSRRERKSSSSSGKGIRTVAPPPGVGSARVRRDSALSDSEDVFEEDGKSPTQKTSSLKKEDQTPTKVVPAPPPKENIWEKRKQQTSPPNQAKPPGPPRDDHHERPPPTSPIENSSHPSSPPAVSQTSAPSPKENAWEKGKPDLKPAEALSENVWARRKQEQEIKSKERLDSSSSSQGDTTPKKSDDESSKPNAWTSKRGGGVTVTPAGRGKGGERGERGRGRGDRGRGRGQERSRPSKPEKPLPKSLDEMPKYEAPVEKDWSDANKFSSLMDAEDEFLEAED